MILAFLFVTASLASIPIDRVELDNLHKKERELNEKMRELSDRKRRAETEAGSEELQSIIEEENKLNRQRDELRDERHRLLDHHRKMPPLGRHQRLEEFHRRMHDRKYKGAKLLNHEKPRDLNSEEINPREQPDRMPETEEHDKEVQKHRIHEMDWKSRKAELLRRIDELRHQRKEDEEGEEELGELPHDELDIEIEALEAELFAGRKEWERKVEEQREADEKERARQQRRKDMGNDAQPVEERAAKLKQDSRDVDEEMKKQAEQRRLKMEEEREKLKQNSKSDDSQDDKARAQPLSATKLILIGIVACALGYGLSAFLRNTKARKFKHKKADPNDFADNVDTTGGWP